MAFLVCIPTSLRQSSHYGTKSPLRHHNRDDKRVCITRRHQAQHVYKSGKMTWNMMTATTASSSSSSSTQDSAHPESLSVAWPKFAERMKSSGEVPPLSDWHELLDGCVRAGDKPSNGVWVLNLMRETGVKPNAVTYEKLLTLCATHQDRVAAFHLVEHMYNDKILLGDVDLPLNMEDTLRAILPPEAFE